MQNRKKWIKWLLLAGLTVYACVTIIVQQTEIARQNQKRDELSGQLAQLEQEKERLEKARDYVGSDEYAEQQAREELGWVKDGEIIFKDKDGASASPSAAPADGDASPAPTDDPASGGTPPPSATPSPESGQAPGQGDRKDKQ